METLVSDCFPPIFSYLSLADLLNLRILSCRLKQEVEDYLPTVRSLPLYLTTPRTPEKVSRYENICNSWKSSVTYNGIDYSDLLSEEVCFRRLRFGTTGPEAFEDLTILQNQNHFRCSDFLILNHSSALSKFLPLIRKLCPNIEKLALVIDHCDHYLPEVVKVLETFPTIKVLLLERTLQDAYIHSENTVDKSSPALFNSLLSKYLNNRVKLSPEVYNSILARNHLEELYFFPKRQCQLFLDYRPGRLERHFLRSLFERLRVFHINLWFDFSIEMEKPLEELACQSDTIWSKVSGKRFMFPRLKKLILLDHFWSIRTKYPSFPKPSLKFLDISNDSHSICPILTQNLNVLTSLERFHCGKIFVERENERIEKAEEEKEYYDLEIVPDDLKNWTIKHLQVLEGPVTTEGRRQEVQRWSKYFVALETCTFLEPEYSVVRVSDLRKW